MISEQFLNEAKPIIEKLAKNRSSNGSFAYYESSDIYQEIWLMCLDAMKRYNPSIGPIENYLVRHVTNRTKNLKRDKYFRPGSDASTSGLAKVRMNLINALPITADNTSGEFTLLCPASVGTDPIGRIICNETLDYVRQQLPESLIDIFDMIIGNNTVKGPMVDEVRQRVAEILVDIDNNVQ